MEKSIINKFTNEILVDAPQYFGISTDNLTNLHGFQNFVYNGKRNGENVILRIAHNSHRSEELTLAEIEFVSYLSECGMSISKPLLSKRNNFVEIINKHNNVFIATAFEMAAGRKAKIAEESNLFYERLGHFTGKMHRISLNFKPVRKRYEWDEKAFLTNFKNYVPEAYHQKFENLMNEIHLLPKDELHYGLIHGDISHGNYLNNEDHPSIIDFDECEYSWFASEIAIPLFYEIPIPWVVNEEIRKNIAKRFFVNFMNGYTKENTISDKWLKTIPLFINLRQAVVVSAIYRSFDFNNYSNWNEWDKQALNYYLNNIKNDIPYIDLDFCSI